MRFIHFKKNEQLFILQTNHTCYRFFVMDGYLYHLYYGKNRKKSYPEHQAYYRSFAPYFETSGLNGSPDTCKLEIPFFGNGDFRASALKLRKKDGDCVTDFKYVKHKIYNGRPEIPGLPYAQADDDTQTLTITLHDNATGCDLLLHYVVFPSSDIISRSFTLINNGKANVKIEKAMSLSLDIEGCNFDWISLYGQHNMERMMQRSKLLHGRQSVFSRRGASSHQFNPFIALLDPKCTEEKGNCYGFNFVYSGNFLDDIEVDQCNNTRVQIGLGEENFGWLLMPGESFYAPEAVMTYTDKGIGQMSRNFHNWIRRHLSPKEIYAKRPVVLNTWEASGFAIDENSLLTFADAAVASDIDMLVMDDGWFGARCNDCAGLGDWTPNPDKFKDGLAAFVKRVKEKGIKFGIWIEPEMVNPDSDLFRAHPDWCLHVPGRTSTLSRNQLVLDMANPDVFDYLTKTFSETFRDVPIDYIKWDMNRHLSEVGSPTLPPERQDEVPFRYMLGVYRLYTWFNENFPHVMIENCSGGGGRYDLGMLPYCTQIWTSDNTWPNDRIRIQHSSTLAYPVSIMSCHVSNAGDQTKNPKTLQFAYHTAMNGMLGYEMHLPTASKDVKETIKNQISTYRNHEELIKTGDLYRVFSPFETPYYAYYFTNGNEILLTFLQATGEKPKSLRLKISSAEKNAFYMCNNQIYSGKDLRQGIEITTSEEDKFSIMLYFKKQ